jgi:N-acetylneuraminic acid mutarotase
VDWAEEIPVSESYWRQLGLAGPVAGSDGDHLIVAGGANFPEPARTSNRSPVLGKVYWTDAFVLRRTGNGSYAWVDADLRLQDAIGYAACISTSRGVLVLGGEGFRGGPNGAARKTVEKFAEVFYLRWDARRGQLVREDLPSLPHPLSYGAAARVGSTVFVAEGESFYSLDLDRTALGWKTLKRWPGDPRTVAVGATDGNRFYLLSGRGQQADGSWRFYEDAYAYDPRRAQWSRVADLPFCVTAGVGVRRSAGFTVVGGDKDIDRWNLIQKVTAHRDEVPTGSAEWALRNDVLTWIYDHHTGFNTEVLGYDSRRDRWSLLGHTPGASQVTTPAVEWRGETVIASGEIRPGIRTAKVWALDTRQLR